MGEQVRYLFNVNHHVYWGILVAIYFYYTGMSAGSFVLSSLGTVFGIEKYKKVAKVGIIMAIILLVMAPVHLIADLARPARFWTLLIHVHFTSAMSWGVFLLTLYPLNAIIYAWFLFREDLVKGAEVYGGFKGALYRFLTLGQTDLSPASLANDKRKAKFFGTLGVPLALLVHGYTGFILANVQARAIWHSALMPFIFLMSAMVSGTGLFIIILALTEKFLSPERRINEEAKELLYDIGRLMMWFIIVDASMMISLFIVDWYSNAPAYAAGWVMLHGPEKWSFLGLENILGMLVPFLILLSKKGGRSLGGVITASVLTIIGVLAMRINLVIGGQKIPLSGDQMLTYHPSGYELGMALLIAAVAVILLWLCYALLPVKGVRGSDVGPAMASTTAAKEGI